MANPFSNIGVEPVQKKPTAASPFGGIGIKAEPTKEITPLDPIERQERINEQIQVEELRTVAPAIAIDNKKIKAYTLSRAQERRTGVARSGNDAVSEGLKKVIDNKVTRVAGRNVMAMIRVINAIPSAGLAGLVKEKEADTFMGVMWESWKIFGQTLKQEAWQDVTKPLKGRENYEKMALLNAGFDKETLEEYPILAGTAEAFVGVLTDPAIIAVPFRKSVQEGLRIAAREGRAPKVFQDTVAEMVSIIEATPQMQKNLGKLAAKADLGDKVAAKKLGEELDKATKKSIERNTAKTTGEKRKGTKAETKGKRKPRKAQKDTRTDRERKREQQKKKEAGDLTSKEIDELTDAERAELVLGKKPTKEEVDKVAKGRKKVNDKLKKDAAKAKKKKKPISPDVGKEPNYFEFPDGTKLRGTDSGDIYNKATKAQKKLMDEGKAKEGFTNEKGEDVLRKTPATTKEASKHGPTKWDQPPVKAKTKAGRTYAGPQPDVTVSPTTKKKFKAFVKDEPVKGTFDTAEAAQEAATKEAVKRVEKKAANDVDLDINPFKGAPKAQSKIKYKQNQLIRPEIRLKDGTTISDPKLKVDPFSFGNKSRAAKAVTQVNDAYRALRERARKAGLDIDDSTTGWNIAGDHLENATVLKRSRLAEEVVGAKGRKMARAEKKTQDLIDKRETQRLKTEAKQKKARDARRDELIRKAKKSSVFQGKKGKALALKVRSSARTAAFSEHKTSFGRNANIDDMEQEGKAAILEHIFKKGVDEVPRNLAVEIAKQAIRKALKRKASGGTASARSVDQIIEKGGKIGTTQFKEGITAAPKKDALAKAEAKGQTKAGKKAAAKSKRLEKQLESQELGVTRAEQGEEAVATIKKETDLGVEKPSAPSAVKKINVAEYLAQQKAARAAEALKAEKAGKAISKRYKGRETKATTKQAERDKNLNRPITVMEQKLAQQEMEAARLAKNNAGTTEFYSGIPLNIVKRRLLDPLAQAYTKAIDKLWLKASRSIRKKILSSARATDILSWIINDLGKSRAYQLIRRDAQIANNKWEFIANKLEKAIKKIDGEFVSMTSLRVKKVGPRAIDLRAKQIAGGSITSFGPKFDAITRTTKRFERLEKMLSERGLLKNHQFRDITKKGRAALLERVKALDETIETERKLISQLEGSERKGKQLKDAQKRMAEAVEKRLEELGNLQVHYKNSGKTYFTLIKERIKKTKSVQQKFNKMKLDKRTTLRRDNWQYKLNDDGTVTVKAKGKILKDKRVMDLNKMVRKGIEQEAHLANQYDMYERISRSNRWVWKGKGKAPAGYVKIEGGDFGALTGKYVQKQIADELLDAVRIEGELKRWYKKGFTKWKAGKVVWSLSTQTRNLVTNFILADTLGDVSPFAVKLYADAASTLREVNSLVTGKALKNKYAREIREKTTIQVGTFTQAELQGYGEFFDFEKLAQGKGSIIEMFGKAMQSGKKQPGKLYSFMEGWMKTAVYINARKSGKSIIAAEAKAKRALFDYNKVPKLIKWARLGYSPFITFSYKAIPALLKQTIRKPWKTAKYLVAAQAYSYSRRALMGESWEEEERARRTLPDYMQDMIGMPSHLKLNVEGEDGRTKFLDISYLIPWGDINEQWGDLDIGTRIIMPNHPVWNFIADIRANENVFFEKPIVLKHEDGGEKWLKILGHAVKQVAPGILNPEKLAKIGRAWRGDTDIQGRKQYSIGQAMADHLLGIKVRNVDIMQQEEYRHIEIDEKINSLTDWYAKEYERIFFKLGDKVSDDKREMLYENATIKFNEKMDTFIEETYYLMGDKIEESKPLIDKVMEKVGEIYEK